MASSISIIRIPDEVRYRLERTAKYLKKDKNWIINQALDEYLRKVDRETLASEARRQSFLATRAAERRQGDFWESISDTRGWG